MHTGDTPTYQCTAHGTTLILTRHYEVTTSTDLGQQLLYLADHFAVVFAVVWWEYKAIKALTQTV